MHIISDFSPLVHPVDCLVVVRYVVFFGIQNVKNICP